LIIDAVKIEQGKIVITKVQPENSKSMDFKAFANGLRIEPNVLLNEILG